MARRGFRSPRRGAPFGRANKGALAVLRLIVWGASHTASPRLAVTPFRLLWVSQTCSEVPQGSSVVAGQTASDGADGKTPRRLPQVYPHYAARQGEALREVVRAV